MALQYKKKELYGGAIQVNLPSDLIDASDLREIPDHQEVFLRPTTLTSIIFEINEYQTPQTIESAAGSTSTTSIPSDAPNSSTISPADEDATTHHLKDVIPPEDHISPAGIETSMIKLSTTSVANFPTYLSTATIITPELDRSAKSSLPLAWQSNPAQKEYETKTQQLLLRLKDYGTDLCVRINIPLKEFEGVQSEAALTEVAFADQIMKKIIESLDIKIFELFGAAE